MGKTDLLCLFHFYKYLKSNTMKRKLLLLTILFFIISIGLKAQIITNGDFETGDLTGWTVTDGTISDEGDAISGSYSFFKGWGNSNLLISQVIDLEAGKEYSLNFDTDRAWDWIYVYAKIFDATADTLITGINTHLQEESSGSVDFIAPEGGSVRIEFSKSADSPGKIWIDNVVVEEKTGPLLVENGDFETGDLTGWENHAENGSVQSAADLPEENADQIIDGVYSYFKGWGNGQMVSQVVEVEPGQEYTLSFEGFIAWNWIYVYGRVFDTSNDEKLADTHIFKTDSVQASVDFIAPESGSVEIRFAKSADSPGKAGIDNITLVAKTTEEDEFARVQIIHNSADTLVDVVDIYVNEELFLEDVAFRQATPFMDVPAGVDLDFVVTPADEGIENGVGPVTVNFTADGTYVVVAAGNVSDTGYDPVQPFALYAFDAGQEQALAPENTDVLVFHGATDAPVVSVWETAFVDDEIIGEFAFGDFAGYLELTTQDYILEVRDATGETTVASYQASLSSLELGGEAIVVVASGFLTPENNSDGPAFGLYVALPSGGNLLELPLYEDDTNVLEVNDIEFKLYPNPASSILNIESSEHVTEIKVIDMLGQIVYSAYVNGQNHTINLNQMRNGIYFIQINTQSGKLIEKIQVR